MLIRAAACVFCTLVLCLLRTPTAPQP